MDKAKKDLAEIRIRDGETVARDGPRRPSKTKKKKTEEE
jgi:hypothetical protein